LAHALSQESGNFLNLKHFGYGTYFADCYERYICFEGITCNTIIWCRKSAVASHVGNSNSRWVNLLLEIFTHEMAIEREIGLAMKKTILIVDDDQIVCSETAKALSQNYQTYTAFNGREALEFYNKQRNIDLVLTDMMMPEMNGMELIKILREQNKDISIILCSGCLTGDEASEALQHGAHACISKPVDIAHLELSIQSALQKHV